MITFKTLNQIIIFFTLNCPSGLEPYSVVFRTFDNAKLLLYPTLGKYVYDLCESI